MTIPVLDASSLSTGTQEQRAEFSAKFLEGMKTHGFVKLVNHTVPFPLVKETFDQVTPPSIPPVEVNAVLTNGIL